MNVSGAYITAAFALAASAVTAIFAYVASRKNSRDTRELEKRKLNGADYDRYRSATDTIIADLRKEVDRLKTQVAELLVQVEAEKEENKRLRQLAKELTETANTLRYQIALLERQR